METRIKISKVYFALIITASFVGGNSGDACRQPYSRAVSPVDIHSYDLYASAVMDAAVEGSPI